jgi:methylmalonyl-CoA mutase
VDAARKSGASIFAICSTDETYPDLVPAFTALVKDALPKSIVIVAGYPKDHIDAFKAAGVDEFIHIRANCYEVLGSLAAKIGVNL